jgi:hypothetical protein
MKTEIVKPMCSCGHEVCGGCFSSRDTFLEEGKYIRHFFLCCHCGERTVTNRVKKFDFSFLEENQIIEGNRIFLESKC